MSKLLLIEDEEPQRRALATKLRSGGHEVLEAPDGQIGLELALAEKPDLILLDMIMPRMTGSEMLDHLRQDEWGREVTVIVLSNLDPETPTVARVMRESADLYMAKADSTLEDIAALVAKAIAKDESEDTST